VEIWGKVAALPPPPPPPPPPAPPPPRPAWDPRGWERLGEASVDGRADRDFIHVGREEGRFTTLMLVVEGGDVEIYDVNVIFGNGERFSPPTRYYFREGSRTGAIDLPGDARSIRGIELRYGSRARGARVEVWGRQAHDERPPAFDPRGWRKL